MSSANRLSAIFDSIPAPVTLEDCVSEDIGEDELGDEPPCDPREDAEIRSVIDDVGPHPFPVLFKAYAQKGSRNIAKPSRYHQIMWRVDHKGRAMRKGMDSVIPEKAVGVDSFYAPRNGIYQVMVWCNWRAERVIDDEGGVERVLVPADIYMQLVRNYENSVRAAQKTSDGGRKLVESAQIHQIGSGHGGEMCEMEKGDCLRFFAHNGQGCEVMIDSDNTFVNVGSVG